MGKVYFIGAGPGDPELITVKGRRLIAEADLVLFAGSLVPREVVAVAKASARVVDSAPLSLEETHALLFEAAAAGGTAARVHTGDPSLFGAVREQIRLLDRDGIPWEIVPGVTAAFAAAARAGVSFTVPEVTQTLVLTRLAGRTPVPEREKLSELARHGASMAVYLSAGDAPRLAAELSAAGLPGATPVIVAYKVGWPGERLVRTTLDGLPEAVAGEDMGRQTLFLVLPGELDEAERVSRLYNAGFGHGFRPGKA